MPTTSHAAARARRATQATALTARQRAELDRLTAATQRRAQTPTDLTVDLAPLATLLGRFLHAVGVAIERAWRASHPREAALSDARTARELARLRHFLTDTDDDEWG